MPGWKIQPTMTVPLPEDVADGLWIKIHHPKLLPYSVTQVLMSMKRVSDGSTNLDDLIPVATELIVDWNLPGSEGPIVKIPKDDPEVWKKIPTALVINTVLGALGDGEAANPPDPNSSNGSASS